MRKLIVVFILAFFFLVAVGCASGAVKDQAARTAVAHDRYAKLIESTFDGTIAAKDGTPISFGELAATPPSVKALLANLVRAIYVDRRAWYQINFGLNGAPDPSTLSFEPPAIHGLEVAPIGTGN